MALTPSVAIYKFIYIYAKKILFRRKINIFIIYLSYSNKKIAHQANHPNVLFL